MRRIFLISAAIMLLPAASPAQDTNYWDTQYGTKGQMLGGLVVGYPSDLSATFYNPGWIALDVDGTFLLTTQAVEAYSIKLKDGLGEGFDINTSHVDTSPGYLAGRFTTNLERTWSWAYSYLQKVKFSLNPRSVIFDPDPLPPTDTNWASQETFRNAKTNEYWYGVTAARRIKPKIALGVSPYVVYRSTESRVQTSGQAVDTDGNFSQLYIADDYKFWNARLLAKIGLAFNNDVVKLGLTMTTPSLGILGSGESLAQASLSGLDVDGDGAIDPAVNANNYQEGLSTSWQSPLSIALGATWKPGQTGVHATVEWFNSISLRTIMEPESFTNQSTGETVTQSLTQAADQVLNFGVGVEHNFQSTLSLYMAFRSDFTSSPDEESNSLALSTWDLWHVSGGAAFRFLNMEFNTGIQYSWGSRDAPRFLNFNPGEGENLTRDTGTFDLSYQRIKVLVGFNLPALGLTTPQSDVAP